MVNFCPLVGPSMTSMVNTGLGAAGALRLRAFSFPAGIVPNLGRRFRDSRGDEGFVTRRSSDRSGRVARASAFLARGSRCARSCGARARVARRRVSRELASRKN